MVKIYIDSVGYNINEYESVYNLKECIYNKTEIDIDDQILSYNGLILRNDKCLKEYNIKNHSTLTLNHVLNGGFDTLSVLIWLLYACAFMFYLLILISGLIPVVAYTYAYLLNWVLNKVGSLTGLSNNSYYRSFVYLFMFMIGIVIVYYFVYATTSFMAFPIFYTKFDKICPATSASNSVGFWVALAFIIVYGLFNIPNIVLNLAVDATELNYFVAVFIQPILGVLENFANVGKFAGIYAIPFVGTPFLEGYHFAVGLISTMIKEGLDMTKLFSCKDKESEKQIGLALRKASKEPGISDWIKSYHAEKIFEVIVIGLIPELYNNYQCRVENMPPWEKIFNKDANKFYAAKYATKGFCFSLKLIHALAGIFDYIGGSSQLANMIRTGNMGGVIAFIVLIIALIWNLI